MITYKGYDIFRAGINSSGIRYYVRTRAGILRADTLAGIRKLINEVQL